MNVGIMINSNFLNVIWFYMNKKHMNLDSLCSSIELKMVAMGERV